MNDGLTVDLAGAEKLLDRMSKLPDALQKKTATRAVRRGANIIRDAARKNADRIDDPSTPERISKNIVVQGAARVGKREGGVAMRIGVLGGARAPQNAATVRKNEKRRRRTGARSLEAMGEIAGKGKGNPGGDTFYWRFAEFGTRDIPARPIFRPAVAQSEQKVISAIAGEIEKDLNRLEQL